MLKKLRKFKKKILRARWSVSVVWIDFYDKKASHNLHDLKRNFSIRFFAELYKFRVNLFGSRNSHGMQSASVQKIVK